MSSSRSVAKAVAEAAHDLDGSYAPADDGAPRPSNVTFLRDRKIAQPAPRTLAECVPLLTIALDFVDRGPSAITVEGVEQYRATAIGLLEHVQPVIERQTGRTLADWVARHANDMTNRHAERDGPDIGSPRSGFS
jgi:hypothetical protein